MEAFISVAAAFLMIVGIVGIFWAIDRLFPIKDQAGLTNNCPVCDSDQIEGDSWECYGDGGVTQTVRCLDCDSAWIDCYELAEQIVLCKRGKDV